MPPAPTRLGLAAPFALMCVLAFGLTAWLYSARLDRTLSEVEDSRLRFTLADLRADFEKSLDRGFALRQLAQAQAAIAAEARLDRDILSIDVLDASGQTLFHTGAASAPLLQAPGGTRIVRAADAIVATAPIAGNTGGLAGARVLRYSYRAHQASMAAIRLRLAGAALAAALACSAGFLHGLRRLAQRRQALTEQVEHMLVTARRGEADDPALAELVDAVNQKAATALVEVTAARHALSAAEATQ